MRRRWPGIAGAGNGVPVYLPRVHAIATREPARRRPATLYGTETVLLVGDDRQVREGALAILRRHRDTVIAACSGDEAVRSCEAHPHTIHLLLTDMVMPGLTGRELARRLLHIRPGMKVLCMSGYIDEAHDPAAMHDNITYLQRLFRGGGGELGAAARSMVIAPQARPERRATRPAQRSHRAAARRRPSGMQQNASPGQPGPGSIGSYSRDVRGVRSARGRGHDN